MIDFETWRETYPSTSYADQVAFHDEVWRQYPLQTHTDLESAESFFAEIPGRSIRVLEIGGWTGVTAGVMLNLIPRIEDWLNIEICHGAAAYPATTNPAYRAVVLNDWIWNQPAAFFAPFGILFASHVFEHMTGENIKALLAKIGSIRYLYIDAPLPWEGISDWCRYPGTHILEWNWEQLLDVLKSYGWEVTKVVANCRERSTVCMFGKVGVPVA